LVVAVVKARQRNSIFFPGDRSRRTAAVALALNDMIYLTDGKVAWFLRWCGRAALAGLFVQAALQVLADALQNRSAAAA